MPELDTADKLKLLRTMLLSRAGDLREQSLIRQGKGWFHVSGMGHEALSVAGFLLKDGDYFCGYYRDRPIALARGMDNYDLALSFFAKRNCASGGRQMPAHYSDKSLGIFSIASVVGASLLPAVGFAWSLKLDGKRQMVLATVGDAGTRQGDFFEAVAFAMERQLPVVFLVEDNGIGISTVTDKMHPLAIGMLDRSAWQVVDGCDVDAMFSALQPAFSKARSGEGPQFIWCRTERISSHSSADDHRKYRSEQELNSLSDKDPIARLKHDLISRGEFDANGFAVLQTEVDQQVREEYGRALEELDPQAEDLFKHVFGPETKTPRLKLDLADTKARMVDTINATFQSAIEGNKDVVFFGQDIEDPKGGVFSLTKGLSSRAPAQVFNSPLAESTIIGVAVGMAAYGKRPVFEIQFADYIWPGFNQLATHLSTLHWRSNGEWSAPAVLYAPYGAYLPGGALWHSQANEAAIAHFPGIQIAIPATPEDAAGLFWTAIHGQSPTVILIPKHLMWHPRELSGPVQAVPFGKAAVRSHGDALTIVSWGNCTEVVSDALAQLGDPEGIEVLDLRSIAPLDLQSVITSVSKTGRLLVVQEDAESCSVGQNLIARISAIPEVFAGLKAPPTLIAKPDVNIGYHPSLEFAALPDKQSVARAIRELLAAELQSRRAPVSHDPTAFNPAVEKMKESLADSGENSTTAVMEMRVPILGEGITSARVVSLLVEAGETVAPDDPLCEVETDKALFPIESPYEGRLLEWLICEEDDVTVEQVVARIEVIRTDAPRPPVASLARPAEEGDRNPDALKTISVNGKSRISEGGLPPRIVSQLKHVVPAHMTVRAGWDAIQSARAEAKQQLGKDAPSPTVMVAWAVVQAMKQHPVFCCTINTSDQLTLAEPFDFGFAVALERDALDTAVIADASELDGPAFASAYRDALDAVRAGHSRSKANVPLILTSMGGFDVRDAQPLVVPPAIATLFLGGAHWEPAGPRNAVLTASLCLSFDHRWLNGAAGAHFLQDVKIRMEAFSLSEFMGC